MILNKVGLEKGIIVRQACFLNRLLSAAIEKGDPQFCQAILSAMSRAKIPPAPDKETWQKFRNAPLNVAS
ncbi:hypothetical protein F8O53_03030 [Enterobacter sp. 63]